MRPRLVSFNLCPFVQRAVIVLAHKSIEYDIEYIDLSEPPDWFLTISPLKKVPVLEMGEHVIFDSTAINEFLDEAYPKRLHPDDIYERAMNRSWIEYGGACLLNAHRMAISDSESSFLEERDALLDKLDRLETMVRAEPFFNGKDFSLVDSAYAPMFQRLDYLEDISPGIYDIKRHPRINKWKKHLATLDAVRSSTIPNFRDVFIDFIGKQNGYFSRLR